MTLREWLAWGESQLLAGPHPAKARLDAERLMLHHLGKDRAWLLAHRDDQYAGCGAIGYSELMKRRAGGEPVQYITGECEFFGLLFHITLEALIPRPETEHLVESVIDLAQNFTAPRILDVGTGSGAIAVALANRLPQATVAACDISKQALALAASNADLNHCAIRFIDSDLLAGVNGEFFDIIVSNPPYVPTAERNTLDVEVRDFEPALALFAGADGLDVYRRLIPQAFAQLAPGGFLALEMGYGQHDSIAALLERAGFQAIEFTDDLQGIPRVACSRRT